MPSRRGLIVAALTASAVALVGCSQDLSSDAAGSSGQSGTTKTLKVPARAPVSSYNKWAWFKGTYWIVPEEGVYSIAHNPKNPGTFTVVQGQTVFHLTDYFNGYFTGSVVVKLTKKLVPSCQYVLGEVTPQGAVYLTMFNAEDGTITNEPRGTMVKKDGAWTMVNTMTGPAARGGSVSHWAYMVLSKPGDATFKSLPLAGESIPDFLSACPPGPTISRR